LLGDSANQNDVADTGAGEGDDSSGFTEGGWSAYLTAYSTEKNLDAAGQERVNVQTADEAALAGVQGITSAIAHAIVTYRGQKQLQSIADLLDVTNAPPPGPPASQNNAPAQPVIDDELLMQIADGVSTTDADADSTGLININTAGLQVLSCLPGVDSVLAQSIISLRQSSGYFANIAGLLRVSGMTHDIFKQIAPLITARSETFRISSEGRVNSSGARQRIQAIVHIGSHEAMTLAYREDL
jgi:DNA uptake protein ComE-like DNA-binding protein